jgi:hypothetical protein
VSTLLPSRVIEKWMMNGGSLTLPERTTNAVLDASVRTSKPSVKSLGRFWHFSEVASLAFGGRSRFDIVAKVFFALYRATLIRRRVPQRNFDSPHPRF